MVTLTCSCGENNDESYGLRKNTRDSNTFQGTKYLDTIRKEIKINKRMFGKKKIFPPGSEEEADFDLAAQCSSCILHAFSKSY